MNQAVKRFLKRNLPGPVDWWRRRRNGLRLWPALTSAPPGLPSLLDCCIAYNEHGGYCVPLSSRHRKSVQTILAGNVWEPDTLAFLATVPGDVVHAGTYFGDFLPGLSHSRGPGSKVWGFEPNPENYRCALVTLNINALANVELANAGLGERAGVASMRVCDAEGRALGGMSHVLGAEWSATAADVAWVSVVAVDDVYPADRTLAALQLDVEGFEAQAVIGAMGTIRRCSPLIIVEGAPASEEVAAPLRPLGYTPERRLHDNTVFVRTKETNR